MNTNCRKDESYYSKWEYLRNREKRLLKTAKLTHNPKVIKAWQNACRKLSEHENSF